MTATPLDKLGAPPQRLKRSKASLVGGIASAAGAFILVLLLLGSSSPRNIAIALLVGVALGVWVRLADL
jgi:preprotein translocase subunit SecF